MTPEELKKGERYDGCLYYTGIKREKEFYQYGKGWVKETLYYFEGQFGGPYIEYSAEQLKHLKRG